MNSNLAYKEEFRDELINGRIVLMSPSPATNHNRVSRNITRIFDNYLDGKRCEVFADGLDVYLTKTDRFEPDCMVVCDPAKIKPDGVHGAPDLVVEVLSPGTAKRDKTYKKQVYEACGVQEYWLVNPEEKIIEQYLLINNKFELHDVYTVYQDFMLDKMTEEERAEIITEFKCSLYDDLVIKLEDIFKRVVL